MRLLAPSLALTLALAGCAEGVPVAGPTSMTSPGPEESPPTVLGNWQLESGTVRGEQIPLVLGYRITLSIGGEEAGGRAACNWYGATIRIEGASISIRDFGQTTMGCAPEVEASEEAFLAALQVVDTAAMEGETLVLSAPDAVLRFAPLSSVPTEALVDTVWVLEAMIDGDASATAGGDRATLELREDGRLVGSTGCRSFRGTYIVDGDEVRVTEMSSKGRCPPDLEDQDSHVTQVVGDAFRVAIDDDRLTLTSVGRLGLVYRST